MKGRKPKFRRWISLLTVSALTACMIPLTSAELAQEEVSNGFVDMADVPENIRALLTLDDIPSYNKGRANRSIAMDETAALRIVDTDDLNSIRLESADGQGIAKIFSSPVRYENEDGEIEFIDTSMKPISKAERARSGFAYRNAANRFTVEFGDTASKGINFDYAFTFGAASNTAQVGIGKIQTEQGHGKIIYPDVFGPDTRVEYINTENGIKENIILDRYTGQSRFNFIFRSDTHVPILTDNKMNILIADKDNPEKIEYRFLSLYAYDSHDPTTESEQQNSDFRHMNEDLYYELTDNGGGVYIITVVVPEEYLTHPEIVYPVTIDPSLAPCVSNNSNTHDTFVSADPKATNYGNLDYIRFGKKDGYKNYGYHRFTSLPSLPTRTRVVSAHIKFKFRSGQTTPKSTSGIKMRTFRVTAHQWYESSITWQNQPYGSTGSDTDITYTNGYLDYCYANITDIVKNWYASSPNYGIYFTYSNAEHNDYNSIVSSEGETDRAPVLTIDYRVIPVTGVTVSPANVALNVNGTRSLAATVSPSDATVIGVRWSSDDTSIATVTNTGVVTARSPGTVMITAKSVADNTMVGYCHVVVKDKTFDIISSLSRDEYYYLVYPSGIGPAFFLSNLPESPVISTLTWEQKLLSIPISRKYDSKKPENATYDALKDELNQALGMSYTRADAKTIYSQYGLATMTTPMGDGMPAHRYTPESVQEAQSEYMSALNTLATLVTFKVAANLNPFDANGNIKFKPDTYTQFYDKNGNKIYPGTNGNVHTDGFLNGYCQPFTFEEGDVFDRYGSRSGRFVAPLGTPYPARSLPPGTHLSTYEKYIVKKPFDAYVGITAPWFNQPGGGIQYKLTMTIQELIDGKYILEITN